MPKFNFEIYVTVTERAMLSVDAESEEEAYECVEDAMDSLQDDEFSVVEESTEVYLVAENET